MAENRSFRVAHADESGTGIANVLLSFSFSKWPPIQPETVETGKIVYRSGITGGHLPTPLESFPELTGISKPTIGTSGRSTFKSLKVTLLRNFGRIANVRPTPTLNSFETLGPGSPGIGFLRRSPQKSNETKRNQTPSSRALAQ
jgi:hypothetical protein